MPELRQPDQLPEIDLERLPYQFDGQTPDDAAAVSLVKTTFGRYESLRRTHEIRWDTAARLYHGAIEIGRAHV